MTQNTASLKGRRFPPEPLSGSEIRLLLRACSRRGSSGIRNAALISLLAGSGLRISEALALRLIDVDLDDGTVRVLHGKGDRSRVVGLDRATPAQLERWLDRRARLGIGRTAPLFCTLDGKPLNPSYVRSAFHRLAAKAGIEKRVTPHQLRHSFATEMSRERQPLYLIQGALGHSSIATTDRYISKVSGPEVVAAMRARAAAWDVADTPADGGAS